MQLIKNATVILLLREHLTLEIIDLFEQQKRRNGVSLGANLVCLGMEFTGRKLGILGDNASFKGQFSRGERLRQPPSSEINHR